MAFDPSADLRLMMADRAEPVTLAGGAIVSATPGVASNQDTLGGEAIISGRTRTLSFVTADVPGMREGTLLTWNLQAWRVNSTALEDAGYRLKAFLGKA